MKLLIIISTMLMLSAGTAWAQSEERSEATVVAKEFDKSVKQCDCEGPVKSQLPLQNNAANIQVVDWITDPTKGGDAPAYTTK